MNHHCAPSDRLKLQTKNFTLSGDLMEWLPVGGWRRQGLCIVRAQSPGPVLYSSAVPLPERRQNTRHHISVTLQHFYRPIMGIKGEIYIIIQYCQHPINRQWVCFSVHFWVSVLTGFSPSMV